MLQVCKNDISLRKCSGGTAHLRTLEGTLFANTKSDWKHFSLMQLEAVKNTLRVIKILSEY